MKSGIDYFPLDVTLDAKMELIEAEFGLTGFGVVVHLLQEIYGKAGYYIEWTNEVALLFARKVGLGGGAVSEIVEASIRRGMFDKEIFNKYRVLTSKGIQKRYFEAVSRRKSLEVDFNILLVDLTIFSENVTIKRVNVNILSQNADSSKQRKEEKSKVEKSKVEHRKGKKGADKPPASSHFVPPTLEEVTAYIKEKGYQAADPRAFLDFYTSKGWMVGKNKMTNWRAAVSGWDRRQRQFSGTAAGYGGTRPQPGTPGEADQRSREDMERLRKFMEGAKG